MNKLNKLLVSSYAKGYRVNNDGEVLGLKGFPLSTKVVNISGYNYFSFRDNGSREVVLTHRLQAYQKYGERMFEEGIVVRHLNGIRTDNSWSNILIGSQSENMMDKPLNQRRKDASHPKHDHNAIIKDRNNGMSYDLIMKKHNISSKGTISFIINKSLIREDNG